MVFAWFCFCFCFCFCFFAFPVFFCLFYIYFFLVFGLAKSRVLVFEVKYDGGERLGGGNNKEYEGTLIFFFSLNRHLIFTPAKRCVQATYRRVYGPIRASRGKNKVR